MTPEDFTRTIRPHYGASYNVGGVQQGEEREGFGYEGFGHWNNLARWRESALGCNRALRLLGMNPSCGVVVEVGCGRGQMTEYLRGLGMTAFGLDISDDPWPPGKNIQASVVSLPFASGSVAAFVALDIVEHLPIDLQPDLLGEIARTLALDAPLLVTVPACEPHFRYDSTHAPVNHYIQQTAPEWWDHFLAHGFQCFAHGKMMAELGAPFDHGLANYPFALKKRGG